MQLITYFFLYSIDTINLDKTDNKISYLKFLNRRKRSLNSKKDIHLHISGLILQSIDRAVLIDIGCESLPKSPERPILGVGIKLCRFGAE